MGKTLLIMMLMITSNIWAEDWNRFRGPNGTGISDTSALPTDFSPTKNIDWRIEIPFGRSSPILTSDQVLITGSQDQKLITVCLDRWTGQLLWQKEIQRTRTQKIYEGNDTATPTPASDGINFYVFFPDFGLVSYGPDGKERWQLKLGPFDSFYGVSSSPIAYGDTLIQVCDQKTGSFIIAVDKNTGRILWRKDRPQAKTAGYSSPVVWIPEDGKPQVIIPGAYRIDSYLIDTGENLWWVGNQGSYPISTPALENGILFATSSGSDKPAYPAWQVILELDKDKDKKISDKEASTDSELGPHFGWADRNGDGYLTEVEWEDIRQESVSEHGLAAIRTGGSGDQTDSQVVWRYKKIYSDITSPLVYRDVLYMVKDGGIVVSLNPETGAVYKTGRTEDAIDDYFASPVAADGKVYLVSNDGKVSVLKADAQWEVLAVNDLGEECQATPAISSGKIYIRTAQALYCFSEKR